MKTLLALTILLVALVVGDARAATVVTKISEYPNTTQLADTDLFLIAVPGVTNKNMRYNQLRVDLAQYFPASQVAITITTNFYFYSTNLYEGDTHVSNYFTTNVFNDTYASNFFNTNYYITNVWNTNIWATNIYVTDNYISNFWMTNINVNDTYVSNYFTTNNYSYTTNFFTTNNFYTITNVDFITVSNAYITNLWTTNATIYNITNQTLVSSNIFTTNLYTTNITAQKVFVTQVFSGDTTATNGFYVVTNYFAGPTNTLDLRYQDQYYAASTPVSITGFTSKSNHLVMSVILTITNASGSNITVYFPNGITPTNLLSGFVITNGYQGAISLRHHPLAGTNAVPRHF